MDQRAVQAEPNAFKVRIAGMDCGSCAMTIENGIRQVPGVKDVAVSFTTEVMDVIGDVSHDDIASRIKELGYRIVDENEKTAPVAVEHRGLAGFARFLWEQPHLRRALFVTLAVALGLLLVPSQATLFGFGILDLIFATGVIVAGAPVFVKGIRALLHARSFTIDLLMAIAAFGAISIGATGEAVTVILLFMLGEALEAYSAERARDSLRSLLALQPQEATVLRAHDSDHGHDHHEHHDHNGHDHDPCSGHHEDDQGHEAHDHTLVLPIEDVQVNDRVLVRPGQRIPVDGEILKGISSINQAPVTGESVPVTKNVGDEVMAGNG